MPETKTIQTFQYDELSDEGTPGRKLPDGGYVIAGRSPKERAHDWLREAVDTFLVDDIDTLFMTELDQRGLSGLHNDRSPSWSLDYSHYPYVAFDGHIDLSGIEPIIGEEGHGDQAADEKHIAAIKSAMADISPDDFQVAVTSNETDFDVEVTCYFDFDGTDKNEDQIVLGVQDEVTLWLQDVAQRLQRMGEAELEHLYSDENLHDLAEANEFLFDATGRPVHHLLEREDA